MENISFINNKYYCELKGYKSVVNYHDIFVKIPNDVKEDLFLEMKRVYNIINECVADTINLSFYLENVKRIDDIAIDIEICFCKYDTINNSNNVRIGFNVYLLGSTNILMQSMFFSRTNMIEIELFNHIYNILFYIYVMLNRFRYDSLFNYFYHKDDISSMKESRMRTIRLFSDIDKLECCVCLEKSITLTECNHILCNKCYFRISPKICPMCRTELNNDVEYIS